MDVRLTFEPMHPMDQSLFGSWRVSVRQVDSSPRDLLVTLLVDPIDMKAHLIFSGQGGHNNDSSCSFCFDSVSDGLGSFDFM